MTVIKAAQKHLEEIAAIEEASFSDPWSRATLRRCIDGEFGSVFVALEDGAVAGHAIVNVMADEAELYNIAVREDMRRRGVGRELLRTVLGYAGARGAARMYLEVRRSNGPARCLYRQAGFAVCGERRDYYQSPREDAILMDIELGELKE